MNTKSKNNSLKNYTKNSNKNLKNRPFTATNRMMNKTNLNQSNNFPLINSNYNNLNQNYIKINHENINNDDEFNLIQNMWEDLGVTPEYQTQFVEFVQNLKDKERNEYFSQEKKSLQRLRENLLKISKEITSRENNIETLKKFENVIETTFTSTKSKLNESIINDIVTVIKAIRVNSVNVINYFIKIREISTFSQISGKFNLNNINKAYVYDKNYLNKMNKDVDFINDSILNKYFDFNNGDVDTFFTCCEPKDSNFNNNKSVDFNNNNKKTISINSDLKKAIIQCKYILSQEFMFDNIEKERKKMIFGNNNKRFFINNNNVSNLNNNNNNSKISQTLFKLKSDQKRYNTLFMNKSINNSKNNIFNNNNNKLKAKKKIIKIEHDEIESMTHDELMNKLNEMEKNKKNKEKEIINEIKNEKKKKK